MECKKRENRTIVCRDYMSMDEKFIRMIDSNLNSIEGDIVNTLVNLAINVIVESLDEIARRKKVIIRDKWQGKQ